MEGQRTTGGEIGRGATRVVAGPTPYPEQRESREDLIETLGELLSTTPDEVDRLLDPLRGDLSEGPGADAPAAFERGLELGLLVGLGSREAARQVIADD